MSAPSLSPHSASSSLRQRNPTPSRSHSGHSHGPSSSSGHGHSHGGVEETEALSSAFKGLRKPSSLDPGSRITLIGLVANVGLTAVKGVAGYILASSALLADAAHSGSDLIADVVTLVSYRVGRWEPTRSFPYGYGSASPSLLPYPRPANPSFSQNSNLSDPSSFLSFSSRPPPELVRPFTPLSLLSSSPPSPPGLHSYHHLLLSLSTIPSIPSDLLASLDFLPHGHSHGPSSDELSHSSHSHSHSSDASDVPGTVDARAMYFALASILVKEYLYRATLKVAKTTHSNVLLANAYHHRSDSLGSLVALVAIGAARVGYPMLDPVGGLVVGGMIAKQGWEVGKSALGGLVDRSADEELPRSVWEAVAELRDPALLEPLVSPYADDPSPSASHSHEHEHSDSSSTSPSGTLPIISLPAPRILASGPSLLIDILLVLPPSLTLSDAARIEKLVAERVRDKVGRVRVREVVVRLRAGEGEGRGEGRLLEGGEGAEPRKEV